MVEILEEQEDNQYDEGCRLQESDEHFVDGGIDYLCRVQCHIIDDAFREVACQLFHFGPYPFGHFQRIGTGELVNGYGGTRLSFQFGGDIVGRTA